ncbi:MAG TPA: YbjN domain-containing protein [Vampirovibrionales bacterium]
MQFQTPAQEACYHKVALWMQELFGKFPCARQDIPGLGLFMGSALVEVLILPWGEEDSVINTRAYVVTGTELTADLMRFLLEQNSNMIFGAFGIDAKGDILFEHSIVGSTCDKKELESSVNAVLEVSDEYDDQLVERWGGKRALDRICGNSN